MKDLYTVVLTEHLNERSCFERDFAFYKGDLLFHFLNFNHVNDPRFCEVSGKRRRLIKKTKKHEIRCRLYSYPLGSGPDNTIP